MYHIGAAHGSSLVVSLAEVTTQLSTFLSQFLGDRNKWVPKLFLDLTKLAKKCWSVGPLGFQFWLNFSNHGPRVHDLTKFLPAISKFLVQH